MTAEAVPTPQDSGWTEEKRAAQRETLLRVYETKPELREQLRDKMTALYADGNPEGERIRRVLKVKGLARYNKLDAERLTKEEVATAVELGLLKAAPAEPAATTNQSKRVQTSPAGTTRPGGASRRSTNSKQKATAKA